MKSNNSLTELDEEQSLIKWDCLGRCETRKLEKQTSIALKSGYIIYLNNKASDKHEISDMYNLQII